MCDDFLLFLLTMDAFKTEWRFSFGRFPKCLSHITESNECHRRKKKENQKLHETDIYMTSLPCRYNHQSWLKPKHPLEFLVQHLRAVCARRRHRYHNNFGIYEPSPINICWRRDDADRMAPICLLRLQRENTPLTLQAYLLHEKKKKRNDQLNPTLIAMSSYSPSMSIHI